MKRGYFIFLFTSALVLAYIAYCLQWSPTGYAEDLCADTVRVLMAENFLAGKGISFFFEGLMAPKGITAPFLSWSWERDFIGALAYVVYPEFPYFSVYFSLSILLSYFGVVFLCRKMELSLGWSALLGALTVLGNFARHFKGWHHFEHTVHHWFLLLVFADALFWWTLTQKKLWSWQILCWRNFIFVAVFGMTGYYWGPAVLLSLIMAGFTLYYLWTARRCTALKRSLRDFKTREVALPLSLTFIYVLVLGFWFWPLRQAATQFSGQLEQGVSHFVAIWDVFRPLWLDTLLSWAPVIKLPPFDRTETVVAAGWIFWLPLWWVVRGQRKSPVSEGGGWLPILPLYVFLWVAIGYMAWGSNLHLIARIVQPVVPFMNFFRTAARFGLMIPMVLGALLAMGSRHGVFRFHRLPMRNRIFFVFTWTLIAGLELKWMVTPLTAMPPMDAPLVELLNGARQAPGSTVLDLPFCTVGGTGTCIYQCPHYPRSIVGQCFRMWHHKKVYGIYQARMSPAECRIYDELDPIPQWFSAWREDRCFQPEEWKNFCEYLRTPGKGADIGSILLYPDLWKAVQKPECWSEWTHHLGAPLQEAEYFSSVTRGAQGNQKGRVFRFSGRCLADQ